MQTVAATPLSVNISLQPSNGFTGEQVPERARQTPSHWLDAVQRLLASRVRLTQMKAPLPVRVKIPPLLVHLARIAALASGGAGSAAGSATVPAS